MKTRLLAASAVFLALLSASMLVTAGQEQGKDGGKGGGKDGGDKEGAHLRRASVLTGMPVVDSEGNSAGSINDMMVDLNTGKIIYFAVQSGGVAGVGGRYHAFAPNAVKFTVGKGTGRELFAIGVSAGKLENEKGFDTNNWPHQPTWGPGGRQDGKQDGGKGGGNGGKEGAGGKGNGGNMERTSRIKGMDVYSAKTNDNLGEVYDLMIDTKDWRIHYAAVSHGGGVAGIGGKLYAVDWKALKVKAKDGAAGDRVFTLNATKNDFDKARSFVSTDQNWPENPDPALSGGGARDGDKGADRDNGKGKAKENDRD